MSNIKSLLLSPRWVGFIISVCALAIYLKTLAPSVTFIDSGELATVACTLGIAHPTGYPLFTLVGWVFSKLPIAAEEITRLNIMAAVFCAAGVYVFFQLIHFLLTLVSKSKLGASALAASTGASLLLAFSETYWSQATSIEVYSLHVFFLSLVMFCFMKANFFHELVSRSGGRSLTESNWWMIFAFVLGLCFTNHMTTVLLAPGLIYLYFVVQGGGGESWKRIARMSIPFVIGLSVYVYLPVRAASGAVLNWGNPVTLEKFLWHLSGKQFRVWIFSSTEAAGRQLNYFINSLPAEFAYVGLVLALIGMFVLFQFRKKLAIGTLLLFVSCVLYSINYDIHDIDSYFLLAYMCVALWCGFAFLQIQSLARKVKPVQQRFISALIIVVSLAPLAMHYSKNDESSNYLVEDYTKNMFASVKPNALVLSFQWDYWVSASYYFQIVKGYRTDVAVVDKELLRRSWYFLQLERRYPWLIQHSKAKVDAYLKELYQFEHELPYNPAAIQSKYVEMIQSFVANSINSRPVYVTPEIEPEFTTGFARVPEGLAFRLFADRAFHGTDVVPYNVRPFQRRGRLEDVIKNMYLNSLNARGTYYYKNGYPSEADSLSVEVAGIAGKLAATASIR
jgi:Protein O-mannosyl-transferase TMEM260-like